MNFMKLKDLEKLLRHYGWEKYGEGNRHSKWTNGIDKTTVPRHREINEYTARSILKFVSHNPKEIL